MTHVEFRAHAALEILKQMVSTGGEKKSKVFAAVEYADLLLHELNETNRGLTESALKLKRGGKK